MAIVLLIALLIGFLFSMVIGKKYISWIEKKGFTQPLKEEVKEKIYSEVSDDKLKED